MTTTDAAGDAAGPGGRRPGVAGIVLAAGAGTRMGQPKALVRATDGEPWLVRATGLLQQVGCSPVFAVLGARADEARALLPADGVATVVVAERWAGGMSESLRAGLVAASATPANAALVTLVDLPDLPPAVLRRLLAGPAASDTVLRQAVYRGQPGHPVVIGRAHWPELLDSLHGDRGARRYLVAHNVNEIECGDLFDGSDVDTPAG